MSNFRNKSILVTGATGFIGRHLFLHLKNEGYAVTGISKNGGQIEGQKIVALDLLKKENVKKFFQKKHFDAICHLAAHLPENNDFGKQKTSFLENITSTLNLLEICQKTVPAPKFIYASGVSVVGLSHQKVTEESLPAPETLYTLSKFIGEMLVQKIAVQGNQKWIILRISAPYGPGQNKSDVIPLFIQNALSNKDISIYGTGQRSQDFIYISDVVNAIQLAIKKNCSGLYNIGSGQEISTQKLAKIILKNVPRTKSKIKFTNIDPQENFHLKLDITKAKKELNFLPRVDIETGIKKYISNFTK